MVLLVSFLKADLIFQAGRMVLEDEASREGVEGVVGDDVVVEREEVEAEAEEEFGFEENDTVRVATVEPLPEEGYGELPEDTDVDETLEGESLESDSRCLSADSESW